MKSMPTHCPSCRHNLALNRLSCPNCDTAVEGRFPFPPLARLDQTDQEFILQFVQSSGSLKEMANLLHVSYPTVRNRLDDVIARLNKILQEQEQDNA